MAASAKAPCSSLARLRRTLGLLVWAGLVVIGPLNAQQSHPLLKLIDDHYNHLRSLRCRYVESYSGMGI